MNDEAKPAPLTRLYDLADLGKAGAEIHLDATPQEREKLAAWLEIAEVSRFAAVITLTRKGLDRFTYMARLQAEVLQSCVVTLAPIANLHQLEVVRALHVVPPRRRPSEPEAGELTLAAGDDETPEEIESYRFDLAAPLLEELSLSLDPYPRAQGVEFSIPDEHKIERESPFAALARLKQD